MRREVVGGLWPGGCNVDFSGPFLGSARGKQGDVLWTYVEDFMVLAQGTRGIYVDFWIDCKAGWPNEVEELL